MDFWKLEGSGDGLGAEDSNPDLSSFLPPSGEFHMQ